jgi:hypothetical protein
MENKIRTVTIENYIIYEDGRVYSKKRNKFLKHLKKQYPCVDLYLKDKTKRYFIHRLIGENFIPNPLNKPYLNHIDHNKYNFNIDNLEWVTHKENIQHCWDSGFHKITQPIKKVICTKTGTIYKSVEEASKLLGYSIHSLYKKLNESYPRKNNTNLKYIQL